MPVLSRVALLETRVYAIRAGAYVKVGITGDVEKRFGHIRSACPLPVELLFSSVTVARPEAIRIEKLHRRRYFEWLVHGEWFRCPAVDTVAFLSGLVAADAVEVKPVRRAARPGEKARRYREPTKPIREAPWRWTS